MEPTGKSCFYCRMEPDCTFEKKLTDLFEDYSCKAVFEDYDTVREVFAIIRCVVGDGCKHFTKSETKN